MSLARFALSYEALCRLICRLVVCHVLAVATSCAGLIVFGVFPALEAIVRVTRYERLRGAPLRVRDLPATFWRFWREGLIGANVRGWVSTVILLGLAIEYRVTNVVGRGLLAYACAGVLLLLIIVLTLAWVNLVFLSAHMHLGAGPLIRTAVLMVCARPLVTLASLVIIAVWSALVIKLPALVIAFGITPVLVALTHIRWVWAKLPGTQPDHPDEEDAPCGSPCATSQTT
ncbi:DUF624 domain-containing protein [Nanchangia anserum]|uniref:DUF624 domain-containing protein n=1 Tax=Nanchangia anserum TaxID=2692125 RepID=A0A8I0KPL3_9ACTO|nr:DUF624 domain-containing protein [Nanchangia anserum]MBD3689015.1 DUF624 domain-containing protein [Nanchangia anserum]QOX81261.1 DUF624 domain-containing protein [Nanchangia anserum]